MSLISDSLKKVHEERNVTGSPPAFNLMSFNDGPSGESHTVGRFLLLIVLPSIVLGGLLYIGINRQARVQVAQKNPSPARVEEARAVVTAPAVLTTRPNPKVETVREPAKKSATRQAPPASTVSQPGAVSPSVNPVVAEKARPEARGKQWPVEADDAMQSEIETHSPVKQTKDTIKPVRGEQAKDVTISTNVRKRGAAREAPPETGKTEEASKVSVSLSRPKPPVEKAEVASLPAPSVQSGPSVTRRPGQEDRVMDGPSSRETLYQNAEFYFKMGVFYQRTGDHFEALENYNKALQLDPENAEIYNNRSLIYQDLGKHDRAARGFLKAIQLDPGYVKAYNNIGLLYFLKNNYAAAVSSFEKAIQINPLNLESYNNLAIVYKKQNYKLKARGLYQTILQKNPNHMEAHYNLALLYEEEGETTKAIEHYRRFADLGETERPDLAAKVRVHLKLLQ